MLIDWFTVGAQALNFLVLVWLLKRFLYTPVQDAIAAREKRIAGQLADADEKRTEAKKDRDDFQHKNDAFDQERAALLKKAVDDANGERERLLDAAGKAADALAASRKKTLQADAENLNQSLRNRVQNEIFAVARKALSDLASASLEERMCAVFVARLRAVEGTQKEGLAEAFQVMSSPLIVRSAFALPAAERAEIQKAIDETFTTKAALRYETTPDLVGGIELSAGGHKLAWSIADYLTSLERGVGELLRSQAAPEAIAKTPPKAPPLLAPTAAAKAALPAVAEPASS